MTEHFLALDLGAGTGRAILGSLAGKRLTMSEIHRFENKPVRLGGAVLWDFLSLWEQVLYSLSLCHSRGLPAPACIGIDSWNLDFGLVDPEGRLLWHPLCYRDQNLVPGRDEIETHIREEELYRETGMPFFNITGLARLFAMSNSPLRPLLDSARYYLPIPDLVRFFLTGEASLEETISWGSQLVSIQTRNWSPRLLSLFGFPERLFPQILSAGRLAGTVTPAISAQTGIPRCPVAVVAEHDTASAFFVAGQHGSRPAGVWCQNRAIAPREPGTHCPRCVRRPGLRLLRDAGGVDGPVGHPVRADRPGRRRG
jgi:rhamnulokinase